MPCSYNPIATAHGLSGSILGIQGYHAPLDSYIHGVKAVIEDALQRGLCSNPQHTSSSGDRDSSSSSRDGSSGTPTLFLYGESFGAALVLHTILRHPQLAAQLTGVITSGIPIGPPEVLPPAPILAVVKQVAKLYPLLPMPKGDTFDPKEYVKAFGDEEFGRSALRDDPWIVRQSRAGMTNVLLSAVMTLEPQLHNITRPLLIMHGLADTRVGPAASRLLFEKAGSSDKVLKLYEGARHQLMQEAPEIQPRVWADLTAWLLERSGGDNTAM